MQSMQDIFTFMFFLIQIIIIFFVGFFLIYKTIKTKIHHLLYNGASFIVTGLGLLFYMIGFYLGNPRTIFFYTCFSLGAFLGVLFVQKTFYKGKKSYYKLVLSLILLFYILLVIINFILNIGSIQLFYSISNVIYSLAFILPCFWVANASLSEYRSLRDKNIEPWLMKRYLISSDINQRN